MTQQVNNENLPLNEVPDQPLELIDDGPVL